MDKIVSDPFLKQLELGPVQIAAKERRKTAMRLENNFSKITRRVSRRIESIDKSIKEQEKAIKEMTEDRKRHKELVKGRNALNNSKEGFQRILQYHERFGIKAFLDKA